MDEAARGRRRLLRKCHNRSWLSATNAGANGMLPGLSGGRWLPNPALMRHREGSAGGDAAGEVL